MPNLQRSNPPDASKELRRRAEKRLKQKILSTCSSEHSTSSSPEDILCMIQEISIHKIELEIQHAELVQSRTELEESLNLYTELYDYAPVGYLTLGRNSKIQRANLTATKLLGVDRSRLQSMLLKKLLVPEDRSVLEAMLAKVFTKRVPGICEVKLAAGVAQPSKPTQTPFGYIVRIDATISDSDYECRVILTDITEQKVAEEKITGYVKQLEATMQTTLQAVAKVVEAHDPYTAGHERRVGIIASDIAREMGWSEDKYNTLELVGLVHDIGKMSIPAEILTKPGKLSAIEFELVKTHAENGYQILKDVEFPLPIARIIREHHERMDGSGYPQGLKGENTLLESRILAVADVLESMASNRPYRPSKGLEEAIHEIESHRAQQFDPEVVDAMLRLFHEKGYQLPV